MTPQRAASGRLELEVARHEQIALEYLVEVSAIALGQPCGLTDVAAGNLQNLRQVTAHELASRLVKRRQLPVYAVQGH